MPSKFTATSLGPKQDRLAAVGNTLYSTAKVLGSNTRSMVLWCPYSFIPPASTKRKRTRRVIGRAATTATTALATVFCCIILSSSTTSRSGGYVGVDAFTFAAVAHSARSPTSSSATRGYSSRMWTRGGRRRRRGGEVMLGSGGAVFPYTRRDAVCFCVPVIDGARPREVRVTTLL